MIWVERTHCVVREDEVLDPRIPEDHNSILQLLTQDGVDCSAIAKATPKSTVRKMCDVCCESAAHENTQEWPILLSFAPSHAK